MNEKPYVSGCTGKTLFMSGKHAVSVYYKWLNRKPELKDREFCIYPCKHCDGWHIGTLMPTIAIKDAVPYLEGEKEFPKQLEKVEQLPLFRRSRNGKSIILWNDPAFLDATDITRWRKQRPGAARKRAKNKGA